MKMEAQQPEDPGDVNVKEYREAVYLDSVGLRNNLLKLLGETRAHKVRPWTFSKEKVYKFEHQYNVLFLGFIDLDNHVSVYFHMTSDPWSKNLKDLPNPVQHRFLEMSYISGLSLASQRETVRTLLQDVNTQITSLESRINNNIVIAVALIALGTSVLFSVVSVILAYLTYLATPVLDTVRPLVSNH